MTRSSPTNASSWAAAAQQALDAKVKPVGALGRLEDLGRRLASLQESLAPRVDAAQVSVFAGDHGVSAEDVSAYPSAVTRQMMSVYADGGAAVSVLGRTAGVTTEAVDVGVNADLSALDEVIHAKVRRGTRNLRREAAMTADECEAALNVGRTAVRRAADNGVKALGLGEMGIGNTTAAAALCSALTDVAASKTVGPGTGVTGERLARKRAVVRDAVTAVRDEGGTPPEALLARLGGLELAAIAGAAHEAPAHGMAVVADGFVSTVAVLAAVRMEPSIRTACFFAHRSPEPGHDIALEALDADPLLDLDLRLGEGTGAALAIPLLRAGADLLRDMDTVAEAGVDTESDR
jgi:nicotinate-nucleotide--dimethylbenzimidazole phosphoribosyltransferase